MSLYMVPLRICSNHQSLLPHILMARCLRFLSASYLARRSGHALHLSCCQVSYYGAVQYGAVSDRLVSPPPVQSLGLPGPDRACSVLQARPTCRRALHMLSLVRSISPHSTTQASSSYSPLLVQLFLFVSHPQTCNHDVRGHERIKSIVCNLGIC